MTKESFVYDKLSDFIAKMNPKKVINFKPSASNQHRVDALFIKQKEEMLSLEEKSELEQYLIINRIFGLAKARAIKMVEE